MNNGKGCVIRCQSLEKIYQDGELRVPVFDNVDLSIAEGETVAIIGASGSGKSTLLQLMGGLDKPTSGAVFIGEKNIAALNENEKSVLRNQQLGFIYQFHLLLQ